MSVFAAFLWLASAVGLGAATLDPLWSYPTGDPILSSPAVSTNHTIYVGSYDQYLYAISSTNGELRWRYSVKPSHVNEYAYIFSTPAVGADGTLYFGTDHVLSTGGSEGELYALNSNGTLKWKYPLSAAVYSDPAVGVDGVVYFGCFDKYLYALNPTGTLKWKFLAGDQIYSDPSIGPDGAVYFGCDNGLLYALNPGGTLRWSFNTGRVITGSAAVGDDGKIYIGSLSSNLFSINPNGTTNWVYPAPGRIESSPAIGSDGTLYVGCNKDRLLAIKPDGSPKWDVPVAGGVRSSPAVAQDGTIYVGTEGNEVLAFDAGGNLVWSAATGGEVYSSPVIAPDGTVFIGSADHSLYAFAGTSGPGTGPWPMFRHDASHTGRFVATTVANTAPGMSLPAERTVHLGVSPVSVAFTVSDAESPADALMVSGTSSNPQLVPQEGVAVNGSGADRTLTLIPTPGQLGETTITLTVSDADSTMPLTATNTLLLRVVAPPLIETLVDNPDSLLLTWTAIAGTTYRVQAKATVEGAQWNDFGNEVTASGATATAVLPHDNESQKYLRVLVGTTP